MRPTPLILAAAMALWPLAAGAQEVLSATGAAGKVREDPAEAGKYEAAMGVAAVRERAAALQAFVQRYPYSPHMLEASQHLLADDQLINDSADAERTARRIAYNRRGASWRPCRRNPDVAAPPHTAPIGPRPDRTSLLSKCGP